MPTSPQDILNNYDARWLLDIVTDAMLVADADGCILLANPAAGRLFGYTPTEFTQLTIENLIPQRYRPQHSGQRAEYAAHPTPRAMGRGLAIFGLRQDGCEFAADVSLSPLEDARVLVTVYDITRRKQLEMEQAQMIKELQTVNEELKNFAHVISHDLKAPLRAIGSLADWIAADQRERLTTEGQEHLRLLIQRVRRMDALIDGVLNYSRIVRKRGAMVAVDTREQVREVIDALAPPSHIAITISAGLPTIRAEQTAIYQVFQNLIGNALRYLNKPQGEINIGCIDLGESWQFSVADNGLGIEARHFERIFLLFQTLHSRDKIESAGVGLAIVKKIIEQYGGKVWPESTVGAGSTFYFTVPKSISVAEKME